MQLYDFFDNLTRIVTQMIDQEDKKTFWFLVYADGIIASIFFLILTPLIMLGIGIPVKYPIILWLLFPAFVALYTFIMIYLYSRNVEESWEQYLGYSGAVCGSAVMTSWITVLVLVGSVWDA